MGEWRIERLDRGHVREGFDCGKPSLNDFLHALVSQYEKRNLGRTYVALQGEDRRVLGYYTLASGAIEAESLPANQAKKLPGTPCRWFCSHGWPSIKASTEEAWAASSSAMP